MINQIDWQQTLINHHRWSPEYDSFRLPVGGYLLAVGIRLTDDSPSDFSDPDKHQYYRGTFHLVNETDDDSVPPLAVINWQYPYNQCGVGFREPLADLNSRFAHLVRRVRPTRTGAVLLITSVHLATQ